MKTWIIEDEPATRMLVKTLAAAAIPTETRAFASAEEALLMLATEHPDLCLIDIDLPGQSGLECARQLRSTIGSNSEHLPYIIMVTAHEETGVLDMVFEAGANDYQAKPVHAKVLKTRLQIGRRLVGQAAMQAESDYSRLLLAYVFNHAQRAMAVVDAGDPAAGLPIVVANQAFHELLGAGHEISGLPVAAALGCPPDFTVRLEAAARAWGEFRAELPSGAGLPRTAGHSLSFIPASGTGANQYALVELRPGKP